MVNAKFLAALRGLTEGDDLATRYWKTKNGVLMVGIVDPGSGTMLAVTNYEHLNDEEKQQLKSGKPMRRRKKLSPLPFGPAPPLPPRPHAVIKKLPTPPPPVRVIVMKKGHRMIVPKSRRVTVVPYNYNLAPRRKLHTPPNKPLPPVPVKKKEKSPMYKGYAQLPPDVVTMMTAYAPQLMHVDQRSTRVSAWKFEPKYEAAWQIVYSYFLSPSYAPGIGNATNMREKIMKKIRAAKGPEDIVAALTMFKTSYVSLAQYSPPYYWLVVQKKEGSKLVQVLAWAGFPYPPKADTEYPPSGYASYKTAEIMLRNIARKIGALK